ncbi:MAG: formimidoylglutamase [Bacteroidales bacterium]|nr:formimidoylglutamase [Bacteroidales bacterium]MBR5777545.1 formimidoylglutamase [Bacteroidales bacterium]
MNLETYLEPISFDEIGYVRDEFLPKLGDKVVAYTQKGDFPEINKRRLALLGIKEDRNAVNNEGCKDAPNEIRKKLYDLSIPNYDMELLDVGNIEMGKTPKDTYFATIEVVAELLHHNITPIILGGGQELTYAVYKAYERQGQIINIFAIDPRFDLGAESETLNSRTYLSKIILSQPNFLFNFTNVGYQTYFVDKNMIDLMQTLHFDAQRLGVVRAKIDEVEPLVRNADMVTVDVSAIRQSDAPACGNPTPHGFYGEEICQMARYAGMSDKLSSIGFYELNPKYENNGQTAHLVAHAIWYFIEGFYNRLSDFPYIDKQNYKRYTIPMSDESVELVFYKSKKSDRWWIEIPCDDDMRQRYARHLLVPCSYADYQQALNNEIPNRWWNFYNKLVL